MNSTETTEKKNGHAGRRLALISSIAVLALVGIYFINLRLGRLSPNFNYQADINSFDNLYNPEKQTFEGETQSHTTYSYTTTKSENGILDIKGIFDVRKPTGEKIFSVERHYGIDQNTGAHVKGHGDKDREGFLFAPKNLHKQDFTYWHISYDKPITMRFKNEETILGLTVYHYTAIFQADQTKALSYLPLVGVSRGVILDVALDLWIEPKTGWMIKNQDAAQAYYYDLATGKRLELWNSFRNTYTSQSVYDQAIKARNELQRLFITEKFIPGLLVVIFLSLIVATSSPFWFQTRKYPWLFPFIVLISSLSGTMATWYTTKADLRDRQSIRFEIEVGTIKDSILNRFDLYANALRAAKGLLLSCNDITRTGWKTFAETIALQKNFPGAQGLGYAVFIRPEDIASHIKKIRAEGFPGYTVRPPGDRAVYSSIIYLEPFDERNQRAFGFDMYQEPIRHEAMNRARDSGDIALSGKVTLVQETEVNSQPGFLLYNPVYKKDSPQTTTAERQKNIIGYVYSPFRMNDLMQGVVGSATYNIDYEIFDSPTTTDENTKLFDYDTAIHAEVAYLPLFSRREVVDIFGRQWLIQFTSLPNYGLSAVEEYLPTLILFIGSLVSLLMFGIVYYLVSSRQRALTIAEKMTRELVNKKNELIEYIDTMSTFNGKLNPEGNFILCNKSAIEALGLSSETVLKSNFVNSPCWTFNASTQAAVAAAFKKAVITKKPVIFNEHAKFKDTIIYLNIRLTPVLNTDGSIRYLVAEGHNITDLKTAEERLQGRTDDLERLTRSMVGRELKMIELKNELKRYQPKKPPKKE